MSHTVIKHSGSMPADYTGIVYNDTGKNNYAAMVAGVWLKRRDHNVRWFASAMAAAAALDNVTTR